ncbi:MAG: SoxR reducing system RseC family protein [Candidatus Marinimicrobia bacterium]|jgi:positive regulator of sigma E activity|nr:SoxR reducing system RseC family protein [Candidatus Neomarinimicrobiota bacterium]MBT4361031.1 SoxR reducing system RseC family protein [Candidatus Neomarinimicrobiota bacterium]MBT4715577.1 SoxR reducing system RseC family protein [Candidatus Neomarinimicrobiota bacterium]MBT4946784.1 SoxR reducing system RseC family protein [Candidatus Neomarinimicrobiota bacterium]MBT5269746.1 SoxR reducing system RseC family protein [Candidatus Neomarinimicrobiota bacterium]
MLYNGETGFIQSSDGSEVTILFTTGDACETCGLKVVCAPGKQSERLLTLPQAGEFQLGQKVQVVELSNLELHLALIQFGLPMATFLIGLFLGYVMPFQDILPRELSAFLLACVGLGFSFFAARHLVQRIVDIIPEKYLRIVPCV